MCSSLFCYIRNMAETGNKNENKSKATGHDSQTEKDMLAALADSLESEDSSINSEDYWFLKLNGNH